MSEEAVLVGGPFDGEIVYMANSYSCTTYRVPRFRTYVEDGWDMCDYRRCDETGEWLFVRSTHRGLT